MAAIGRRRQGDFSCALSAAHRLLLLARSVNSLRREIWSLLDSGQIWIFGRVGWGANDPKPTSEPPGSDNIITVAFV